MIRFHYRYPSFRVRDANEVKSWLFQVAHMEKNSITNLDYIFLNDEELLHINRQSLQHDYYTDILTFAYTYRPITGEIYISVDRIKEQAIQFEVSLNQELRRVMVHGLLHLCGHEDTNRQKKNRMSRKEDQYLATFAP